MSYACLNPVLAYCIGYNSITGKKLIKFKVHPEDNIRNLISKYGEDNVFTLPCGQCESCRKNYADEWALRCQMESFYHNYCYFVTLTYDDRHLPFSTKSAFNDFQKFVKRLQGESGKNLVRYLTCVEQGEETGRIHHHAILFLDEPLELHGGVLLGSFIHYHSLDIAEKWQFGLHDISLFDLDCGAYVAKYTTKNVGNFKSLIHMSRNLGKQYFLDNVQQIIDDDFKIYMNVGKNKRCYCDVPKSFVSWFRDCGCIEVENFVNFKKKIGHLSNIAKTQLVGSVNVEKGISYAQQLSQKKLHYERRK